MNGIPMTGCFRARMPVGTQGTLRVDATRSARRTLAHFWRSA
jgi:hypothetical protein